MRYGIRGLFDWPNHGDLCFLCVTIGASFFAGYRSILMLLFLIFAFQFYFEGLLRTRLFADDRWAGGIYLCPGAAFCR